MRLAAALLVLVCVTHFGYEVLALFYDQHAAAAKAWFYILRGVEGFALFAIVASLARSRLVMVVCALGMSEEGMTAACRASKPIGEVPGYVPFEGLCGSGWYSFGVAAIILVALWLLDQSKNWRAK